MIRIVLSWIGYDPTNPFHSVIHEITEPILAPIRSVMPRIGMFDFSPMIALFALTLILQASRSL